MFSFFKRRKEKKEQETQELLKKELVAPEPVSPPVAEPEPVVPEPQPVLLESASVVEPAPSVSPEPAPTESELTEKQVPPLAEAEPAREREHLVQNADLTVNDHIFTEKKREILDSVVEEQLEVKQELVPEPEPMASSTQEKPTKGSWLSRLRQGLSRTGQSLTTLFVGVKVDEELFEELETALIMADAGVEATDSLLTELRSRVRKEKITDGAEVKRILREALTLHLEPLEKQFPLKSAKPLVMMIAGVNGAGKTTSIGKLAYTFQQQQASVLLAAGDTFRAAAREQLVEWGNRNNVQVIAQEGGNPGAVAFNAVVAGKSREADVVIVDTAGRLPTQLNLMEELKKIKRAITKADGSSPHECLLVIDGNTGQNALAQIKAFDAAIGLTGLVVTKLDGTAKGGILAAVAAGSNGVRPIPVYWIGVGEGMHDLQPFVASEFAGALLGD